MIHIHFFLSNLIQEGTRTKRIGRDRFFSYKPFLLKQLQRKSRFVIHHLQVAVMWEAPNRGGMQQRPHPPQHSAPKKSPNKGNLWQSTAFFENTYSYKTCQIHSIDLEICNGGFHLGCGTNTWNNAKVVQKCGPRSHLNILIHQFWMKPVEVTQ